MCLHETLPKATISMMQEDHRSSENVVREVVAFKGKFYSEM